MARFATLSFLFATVFTLFLSASRGFASTALEPKFSIIQGTTSDTITHFNILVREGDEVTINAANGDAIIEPADVQIATYPGSIWQFYRVTFTGLKPNIKYKLEISEGDEVTDRRNFKTLDFNAPAGRVAIASCMDRTLHNPYMWDTMALDHNRPDLMLFIGDSVYLDREKSILTAELPKDGLEIWNTHANARNTLNVYFWHNLVPIVSVWDDHDAGGNNVTYKTFPLMAESRKIFDTVFSNDEIPGFMVPGPGLSMHFHLYGKNWIMLDNRSFRESEDLSPIWGTPQTTWLLRNIEPGNNMLINGVQFFGKFIQKDSLEFDYPEYAVVLMNEIKTVSDIVGAKVAFVSGDTHFSELQRIEPEQLGYVTYEITSSSAHSFAFPGHYIFKPDNPRRIDVTGTHNIVNLGVSALDRDFKIDVTSIGWRDTVLFHRVVTVGEEPNQSLNSL